MKTNVQKDRLEEIFSEQFKLKQKFGRIEKENGLGSGLLLADRFDIDDPRCQYVVKDHIFRVIEELAEAKASETQALQQEELADALHFIVELVILVGFRDPLLFFKVTPDGNKDLLDILWERPDEMYLEDYPGELVEDWAFNPIYHLSMASNFLKNRPWKQSVRRTNVHAFHHSLQLAFIGLIRAFKVSGVIDPQGVYNLYFHKNQINQDRIEESK